MTLEVSTNATVEVVEITDQVSATLPDDLTGTCTIFIPHTTAGVTINEHESGLLADIERMLRTVVTDDEDYDHDRIDDNASAHLRSILLGSDVTVPVTDGNLDLGTWQSILLVEGDGPRRRRVTVQPVTSK